jgi:glycosyltransferase involved in cell wall biosynthesis
LRILIATPGSHLPHAVASGGSIDIHQIALGLSEIGNEVAVAATLPNLSGSVGVRQLPYRIRQAAGRSHLLVFHDWDNGYETLRIGHWLLSRLVEERIACWRPDVVMVQGYGAWSLASVVASRGTPVVLRHIDKTGIVRLAEALGSERDAAALLTNPLFTMTCNSHFTAAEARHKFGWEPPVIYPPIRATNTDVRSSDARCITFVNPVPAKGLSVALHVAALLGDHDFVFVDGWFTTRRERQSLQRHLSTLPNVTWRHKSVGLDDVFRASSLLLVPSQVEEAFGRVIVEAGQSGVPAVASRIGGIPEAIGNSGVLVEPTDPPERWASVIKGALSDPAYYARLSAAAAANASRDEFAPRTVAVRLLDVLKRHIAGRAVAGSDDHAAARARVGVAKT